MELKEPTPEQCSENAVVFEGEGQIGYAIWYPQMGGYHAKSVALCDKNWIDRGTSRTGGCVDIWLWHDGEWPFHDGQPPMQIHLCDPDQFIEFGEKLTALNNQHRTEST